MLYGIECECGEEIDVRRYRLGYTKCMQCGDREAKKRKFCIAPLNKSNYMMITDLELLKQLNPKRT